MTTKLELAEMIIESWKIGKKIQERKIGEIEWRDKLISYSFDLSGYEYRVKPKKVNRSGWFDAIFLKMHAKRMTSSQSVNDVFIEWEEEE